MNKVAVTIARNPEFLKSKAKHKPIQRHTKRAEPVYIYEVSKEVINQYVDEELKRNAYCYQPSSINISNDTRNKISKPSFCGFGKALN